MKKIYFLMLAALALGACQHDVIYEVDYNVTLDKGNTYYAGEPVKFNVSGNVDNILFYSGETGHAYEYKDRYSVLAGDIQNVSLKIDYEAQWGYAKGLDVYVTNTFEGLAGNDATADRAAIKAMVDGGMQGWTKLDYKEGESKVPTSQTYDIPSEIFDNICVAFHWHPINDGKSAQRTYLVSGNFLLGMTGIEPLSMSFKNMKFVTVMMNEQIADPYQINKGAGSVNFNNSKCDLHFQGQAKGVVDYALDGWVISVPEKFEEVSVDNDKGEVIKNLQNYLHSYEYTWNEPGTYEVVFVGRNENYASASEQVIKYKITILEKPFL